VPFSGEEPQMIHVGDAALWVFGVPLSAVVGRVFRCRKRLKVSNIVVRLVLIDVVDVELGRDGSVVESPDVTVHVVAGAGFVVAWWLEVVPDAVELLDPVDCWTSH
jgi:hypothetical protein